MQLVEILAVAAAHTGLRAAWDADCLKQHEYCLASQLDDVASGLVGASMLLAGQRQCSIPTSSATKAWMPLQHLPISYAHAGAERSCACALTRFRCCSSCHLQTRGLLTTLPPPPPHTLPASSANQVDGDPVPVPHFGVALSVQQFHDLADRLKASGVQFIIQPHLRFQGQPGEQVRVRGPH